MKRNRDIPSIVAVGILSMACLHLAAAQYGGGTGAPNDPYQIWTAEQMNAIGADPNHWDKHYRLMADIDLSAYDGKDGRPEFNIIGPGTCPRTGACATRGGCPTTVPCLKSVFDGNGHTIANLTLNSGNGLFTALTDPNAAIRNLTLLHPTIRGGPGAYTGALVGSLSYGSVTNCRVVDGTIAGTGNVGGLVGYCDQGNVADCNVTATVTGTNCVGGLAGGIASSSPGTLTNCQVVNGVVTGGNYVGGLVGKMGQPGLVSRSSLSSASLTGCHVVNGLVTGTQYIGGLVGLCSTGYLDECHATGVVMGYGYVGGLAGSGCAVRCFAVATVVGTEYVGGLAGYGSARNCYADGTVVGDSYVGGLIGGGERPTSCYASGLVTTILPADLTTHVGGLLGGLRNYIADQRGGLEDYGTGAASFWDIETTGQTTSAYGNGRTTTQMQSFATFLAWGTDANAGVWTIDEGNDYPHLAWEHRPGIPIGPRQFSAAAAGTGTRDDPYLISMPAQLYLLTQAPAEWSKCFKLTADLDMAGYAGMGLATIGTQTQPFTGLFDGNGHTIRKYVHTSAVGDSCGGLFGYVKDPNRQGTTPGNVVMIKNLGLIDPLVAGRAQYAGTLVGYFDGGVIAGCYVDGGLIVDSYYARAGLVGVNGGIIMDCFASIPVVGGGWAGGLVGVNGGTITNCYSTGLVQGGSSTGGLVGYNSGSVTASFWDIQTSGQADSTVGTGLTTAQMQMGSTFRNAGWDFVGETANGTADIWRIDEGKGYPRLWWEEAEH